MVDQMTLQTIGILLTGLTVSIAAIYYTLTLRYTRRNQELQLETRQIQTFMNFVNHTKTTEFLKQWVDVTFHQEWKTHAEWMDKYGPMTNIESFANFFRVLNIYESIGALVKRDVMDPELFYDSTAPGATIMTWEKVEPWIRHRRETYNVPNLFRSFEHLYNEMIRIRGMRRAEHSRREHQTAFTK
jgi:hypothetical protein